MNRPNSGKDSLEMCRNTFERRSRQSDYVERYQQTIGFTIESFDVVHAFRDEQFQESMLASGFAVNSNDATVHPELSH